MTTQLAVIAAAVLLITPASLAVIATVFSAQDWIVFAAGKRVACSHTYALVGACLGPIFGRVGGVLIAFMVPLLDIGIAHSPTLRTRPAELAHSLPGYGAQRVLLDGGLTAGFDQTRPLLLAWAG